MLPFVLLAKLQFNFKLTLRFVSFALQTIAGRFQLQCRQRVCTVKGDRNDQATDKNKTHTGESLKTSMWGVRRRERERERAAETVDY